MLSRSVRAITDGMHGAELYVCKSTHVQFRDVCAKVNGLGLVIGAFLSNILVEYNIELRP